jgi:hypothetical protein
LALLLLPGGEGTITATAEENATVVEEVKRNAAAAAVVITTVVVAGVVSGAEQCCRLSTYASCLLLSGSHLPAFTRRVARTKGGFATAADVDVGRQEKYCIGVLCQIRSTAPNCLAAILDALPVQNKEAGFLWARESGEVLQ